MEKKDTLYLTINYQGKDTDVEIEDQTNSIQEIINKLVVALDLSRTDGAGNPASYHLGRLTDDFDEILPPFINGKEQTLLDYNIKDGDKLSLTMIPIAGGGGIEIPNRINDEQLWRNITRFHFIQSMIALVIGFVIVILGIYVLLVGTTGNSDWKFSILDFESNITNAGPGIILCIIGLLVIWASRINVKVKK